jgi:hypothetical protein
MRLLPLLPLLPQCELQWRQRSQKRQQRGGYRQLPLPESSAALPAGTGKNSQS